MGRLRLPARVKLGERPRGLLVALQARSIEEAGDLYELVTGRPYPGLPANPSAST